ncbi:MAG: gas vesicle protein K [Nocardiopsaceae bacterium]|nr:gas vesicle protein K [Nocardiopsaceae bacterium]
MTARRIRVDGDDDGEAERALAGLVLTVVELLRQLMERQAIRRVEDGTVTDEQAERLGYTLMRLEERMGELLERFGLEPEDLNLDLGPLGTLL